jgi:hypothetical protein
MKTTIRVRKNAATKPAAVQTKTSRRRVAAPESVRILFADEDSGKIEADFEIPKSFHTAMERDAKAQGISLKQWIETAVRNKIENALSDPSQSSHQNRRGVVGLLDEFDGARAQSAALHHLLFDALSAKDEGVYGEKIKHGIAELIRSTNNRMERVLESVESFVRGKVVAS